MVRGMETVSGKETFNHELGWIQWKQGLERIKQRRPFKHLRVTEKK